MPITKKDVERIAELGRLELTAEEADLFTGQLGSIIDHIAKLSELQTEDVPQMSHCVSAGGDVEYAKRDDEVRPGLGQTRAVENAPEAESGYFKVPRVIGG
jgi:aspartyl-tRNA(Asn)/glutamyl-tRNA(Gln) amidotransferase subunit C